MNRRQCGPVAVLVALALSTIGGYTVAAAQHQAWVEREDAAAVELTSAQTAPGSWTVTGQNPGQHYQQCLHAIRDYNTAAAHLGDSPLNASTECTP